MTMIDTPPTKSDADNAEPILPSIGQVSPVALRTIRESRGITLDHITQMTGIPKIDLVAIESGMLQPQNRQLNLLARQLGVPVEAIVKSPESDQEPTEDVAEVTAEEVGEVEYLDGTREIGVINDHPEIPEHTGGWKVTADAEQRQRLYAAQKSADILREYGGSGVFNSGGTKSVNPVDVVTLAQWIVYGTHDQ